MDKQARIKRTLAAGEGILQLIPVFVQRRFGNAGHRLKLHPDDYFALGTRRGSIKERWFIIIKIGTGWYTPPGVIHEPGSHAGTSGAHMGRPFL